MKRARSSGSHKRSNKKFAMFFPTYITHTALQNAMYKYVQNNPDKLLPCKDNGYVKLTKIIDQKTSSDSVKILGELNKSYNGINGVFFKVFFGPNKWHVEMFGNPLHTEAIIYRDVVNRLLFNSMTPHLIAYYGTLSTCTTNSLMNLLPEKDVKIFDEFIEDMEVLDYKVEKMYLLALERAMGSELSQSLSATVDWKVILFQVVWTLLCFKDVGLMHNDLHSDNVFLTILPRKHTFVYYLSQQETYIIETNTFVQVFDFNKSSKVAKPNDSLFHEKIENTSLDLDVDCERYNMCNKYDEKFDITRLLHYIVNYGKEAEYVVSLISKVKYVRSLTVDNGYAFSGIAVKNSRYERPSDAQVLPLRNMLQILGNKYLSKSYNLSDWVNKSGGNDVTVSALPSAYRNNRSSVQSSYSE